VPGAAPDADVRRRRERTCIGCRLAAPQPAMARFARRADGTVTMGAGAGRGAYVHRDGACVERAMRPAVLARALRGGLSSDEVGRLRERIEGELGST
jgi:predicted RNA-binding protein YlxR (DUF448 family)